MAASRMELRSGTVVGQNFLSPSARPLFEEGARLVFAKWTALALAVENQWGGASSADKAEMLLQDSLQWFYHKKGVCLWMGQGLGGRAGTGPTAGPHGVRGGAGLGGGGDCQSKKKVREMGGSADAIPRRIAVLGPVVSGLSQGYAGTRRTCVWGGRRLHGVRAACWPGSERRAAAHGLPACRALCGRVGGGAG